MSHVKGIIQQVYGIDALKLILFIVICGIREFIVAFSKSIWRNTTKLTINDEISVKMKDVSMGSHYYIKVLNTKYHYVECGPSDGHLLCILGDVPAGGLGTGSTWFQFIYRVSSENYRVIAVDLRGCGGSECGSRSELSPPRAVDELYCLLKAVGTSPTKPVILMGHGIGGIIAWYFSHCHGNLVKKLAIVSSPHPNLYWQFPPTDYCKELLYFIQWYSFPERWFSKQKPGSLIARRSKDWEAPLNYIRGAAWYKINSSSRITCPTLLIGNQTDATSLVCSAEYCMESTLRLVKCCSSMESEELIDHLLQFVIDEVKSNETIIDSQAGLISRVFDVVSSSRYAILTRNAVKKIVSE